MRPTACLSITTSPSWARYRYEYARLKIDGYQTVAAANGMTVEGGKPDFDATRFNFGAVWSPVESLSLFASY
ncbi:hypothetical protein [Affinibrenneria salicis]|uniref:hypothetical protein n=1 Tax=Affinibrenneria salicis TaxID=2590031 RepID=UPI001CC4D9E4|nr:hypothetical protein [Affinibrenneria salicis]